MTQQLKNIHVKVRRARQNKLKKLLTGGVSNTVLVEAPCKATIVVEGGELQHFAAYWWELRRALNLPAVDAVVWGDRMLDFIRGLSLLHLGVTMNDHHGQTLEYYLDQEHHGLKKLLTHPLFDTPADKTDLVLWLLLYPDPPIPIDLGGEEA